MKEEIILGHVLKLEQNPEFSEFFVAKWKNKPVAQIESKQNGEGYYITEFYLCRDKTTHTEAVNLDEAWEHIKNYTRTTFNEELENWYNTAGGLLGREFKDTIIGDVLKFKEVQRHKGEWVATWRGYTVATAAVKNNGTVDITEWHPDGDSTRYTSAVNIESAWRHIKNYTLTDFDDELKSKISSGVKR